MKKRKKNPLSTKSRTSYPTVRNLKNPNWFSGISCAVISVLLSCNPIDVKDVNEKKISERKIEAEDLQLDTKQMDTDEDSSQDTETKKVVELPEDIKEQLKNLPCYLVD